MFAPYTARFLEDAGVSRGMKVLDVGTGAGDVALLVADLVGEEGAVIGVDFNPELIETARARVAAAGLENVIRRRRCGFGRAGPRPRCGRGSVRAVFCPGACRVGPPADGSRSRRRHRRVPRARQCDAGADVVAALPATGAALGVDPRDLPPRWDGPVYGFAAAQRLCAGRAPGARDASRRRGRWRPDWPGYEYMARLIRTVLPLITQLGVATQDDVEIDTLADRLHAEIGDDGAAVTWGFITASAPHRGRP